MKRIWLAFLLLFVAAAAPAHAPADPQPISIGTAYKLASKVLGEARMVNVVIPVSYAKEPKKRYPVLYLIDGGYEQDLLHVAGVVHLGSLWARSSEAIVVGIETRDRRKELVGPTTDPALLKKYPTAGSSAAFRRFIRDEVKPLINGKYRTNGQSVVLGESLAGLFIVETYLVEPQLFDGYAAIDPSLWWDKEVLSKTAAAKVGAVQPDRPLFLAMAKEQAEEPAAMNRLVAALAARSRRWCLSERPDLTHATIYQQVTPQALQFLLPPPQAPAAEFGFEVKCAQRS